MKQETKIALIHALKLLLAELKEDKNPESFTVKAPINNNWHNTITTSGSIPEYNDGEISNEEYLLKYRIPLENIDPGDLNLPQEYDLAPDMATEHQMPRAKSGETTTIEIINLEPYIGTVIQLTEEQKESLKNSVIPDEVPDSEFILPAENVKKVTKKKK